MKKKLDDLSLEDQAYTRTLLLSAATKAAEGKSTEQFLEGLLTPSEQIMLGRRVWIARLLLEGKSFAEIGARLEVSPVTIQQVEKQLLGEIPDYGETIKQNRRKADQERRTLLIAENPFSLTALKQKYPLHFLFFPWPK